METMDLPNPDARLVEQRRAEGNDDMEEFRHHVDEMSTKVDTVRLMKYKLIVFFWLFRDFMLPFVWFFFFFYLYLLWFR